MTNLQDMFDESNKSQFIKRIHSEETRARLSRSNSKPKSAETRAKISAAQKIRCASPEARAKMSAAQKGKILSDEHRAKISAALKGRRAAE